MTDTPNKEIARQVLSVIETSSPKTIAELLREAENHTTDELDTKGVLLSAAESMLTGQGPHASGVIDNWPINEMVSNVRSYMQKMPTNGKSLG